MPQGTYYYNDGHNNLVGRICIANDNGDLFHLGAEAPFVTGAPSFPSKEAAAAAKADGYFIPDQPESKEPAQKNSGKKSGKKSGPDAAAESSADDAPASGPDEDPASADKTVDETLPDTPA